MVTRLTQPGRKRLSSTAELGAVIRDYYRDVRESKRQGRPLAWVFGIMPSELWNALGIPVLTLEQIPPLVASRQLSGHYLEVAEAAGFSRDICPYPRTFIGCAISKELDPWLEERFAPPDLMVGANYPCMSESKSFTYLVDRFKVPYYLVDTPINIWGHKLADYAIDYYVNQMKGLISWLEEHGCPLDPERLRKAIACSRRVLQLEKEVNEYRKAVPTPMGALDSFTWTFVTNFISGTETAVRLFEKLRSEVKERFENRTGVIEQEKLRLLWCGVPPFYDLSLFTYPEQYGAVIVKAPRQDGFYDSLDPEIMDPDRPLESLARKHLTNAVNPPYANMIELLVNQVKQYKIDGVMLVSKRGCRLSPAGLRLYKDAIMKECGVPSVIFELDGIDPREYNRVWATATIEAFIETLQRSPSQ